MPVIYLCCYPVESRLSNVSQPVKCLCSINYFVKKGQRVSCITLSSKRPYCAHILCSYLALFFARRANFPTFIILRSLSLRPITRFRCILSSHLLVIALELTQRHQDAPHLVQLRPPM